MEPRLNNKTHIAPFFFVHGKMNNSSAVAEMGDRLATIDMDSKVGGC